MQKQSSFNPRRMRTLARLTVAAATGLATVVACSTLGAANTARADELSGRGSTPAVAVTPAAASSTFSLADPDTLLAQDGRYVTYGTTLGGGARCKGVPKGKLYVPMLVHGSGTNVGLANCAAGDALPGGPGAWAEPGAAIWAPGVARYQGKFYMYYTSTKRGSGQKCNGLAVSTSAYGPFVNKGEWACPPAGRWVIDANPFVDGGKLYVTYRDDAITTGKNTGISVVRTNANGFALWNTRKDVIKSTDITWDTIKHDPKDAYVVENPTMWKSNGTWYVGYSGNKWDSPRYATGIASCDTSPLPAKRCTPLRNGVTRPYFGYSGTGDLNPYRKLPGNHTGPGGLDVFKASDGSLRVVWHWYNGSIRFPMTGVLVRNAGGFAVK